MGKKMWEAFEVIEVTANTLKAKVDNLPADAVVRGHRTSKHILQYDVESPQGLTLYARFKADTRKHTLTRTI